jgi:hypothetical protein
MDATDTGTGTDFTEYRYRMSDGITSEIPEC